MSNTILPPEESGTTAPDPTPDPDPTITKVQTIESHAREIKRLCLIVANVATSLDGNSPNARFFQLARLFSVSSDIEMLALELKRLLLPAEVE